MKIDAYDAGTSLGPCFLGTKKKKKRWESESDAEAEAGSIMPSPILRSCFLWITLNPTSLHENYK